MDCLAHPLPPSGQVALIVTLVTLKVEEVPTNSTRRHQRRGRTCHLPEFQERHYALWRRAHTAKQPLHDRPDPLVQPREAPTVSAPKQFLDNDCITCRLWTTQIVVSTTLRLINLASKCKNHACVRVINNT